MKNDIKYTMLAVGDLLELIEKANHAIERHRNSGHPNDSIISQYEGLKNDYLHQLAEILKDFDIKVDIPHKAA